MRQESADLDPGDLARDLAFLHQRMRDFEVALEYGHAASVEVGAQLAGVQAALSSRNSQLGAFVVGMMFGAVIFAGGAVLTRALF